MKENIIENLRKQFDEILDNGKNMSDPDVVSRAREIEDKILAEYRRMPENT